MNLRNQNQLSMVGACLTLVHSSDYKPVWTGKDPADFATDLALLAAHYTAVTAKAAQADAATGGAADAKALAEGSLEDAAYVLARALANHFQKIGDLDRRGKVDLSRSDIVKLRAQDLLNQATAIRDLGLVAQGEPGAVGRGVTAARVTAVTAALQVFSQVMNSPRGQIVNRSTLLKEVETDIAALLALVSDLDDLVLQFDGHADGRRLIEAWKRARTIVDTGGGHAHAAPAPAATATTPPPILQPA
jgi:hypothetical protein